MDPTWIDPSGAANQKPIHKHLCQPKKGEIKAMKNLPFGPSFLGLWTGLSPITAGIWASPWIAFDSCRRLWRRTWEEVEVCSSSLGCRRACFLRLAFHLRRLFASDSDETTPNTRNRAIKSREIDFNLISFQADSGVEILCMFGYSFKLDEERKVPSSYWLFDSFVIGVQVQNVLDS